MNLAKTIDHTMLKPEATEKDIDGLCSQAREYGFYSVCVNGCHVPAAKTHLKDSDVKVCAVIGFPLGACSTRAKVFEALDVIENGADEIDMVMNIGALKDKDYDAVLDDIKAVVDAAGDKAKVKVILENCLLEKEEIAMACKICVRAGAHFVKTSTGFSKSGALLEDVILMKQTVGNRAQIKAAGGIRDTRAALDFLNAGADRLGLSASVEIILGGSGAKDY